MDDLYGNIKNVIVLEEIPTIDSNLEFIGGLYHGDINNLATFVYEYKKWINIPETIYQYSFLPNEDDLYKWVYYYRDKNER